MQVVARSVWVRPRRAANALRAISMLIGFPLLVSSLATPRVLLVALLLLLPALLVTLRTRSHQQLTLDLGPNSVQLQGKTRSDVESAFETSPTSIAIVYRDQARLDVELADVTANEALTALGFDLTRRTLLAPLRRELGAFTMGFITFVSTSLVTGVLTASYEPRVALLVPLLLAITATVLVVRKLGAPHLIVGRDGLRTKGVLRPRFIPYSQIERVSVRDYHLTVHLTSGKRLQLPTVGQSQGQLAALLRHIERARAGLGSMGSGLYPLERAGRDLTTWRSDLQRLAETTTGYRQQTLDAESLHHELADPNAPADRRLGAALALRVVAPEPEQRERIRLIADTCADEDMRRALEGVLDDTLDDALVRRAERT